MNTGCIKVKDNCYLTVSDSGEINITWGYFNDDSVMERKINLENLIEENKMKMEEISFYLESLYPEELASERKKYWYSLFKLFVFLLLAIVYSIIVTRAVMFIAAPLLAFLAFFNKKKVEICEKIMINVIEESDKELKELEKITLSLEKELSMLNNKFIEENVSFDSIPAMVRDEEETEELNRVKIRKLNLK